MLKNIKWLINSFKWKLSIFYIGIISNTLDKSRKKELIISILKINISTLAIKQRDVTIIDTDY